MHRLLARYAECVFWMARQVERADSLARILAVAQTYSDDSDDAETWGSIVALHADGERFAKRGTPAVAESVLHFYLIDRDNPGAIVPTVRAARENARTLRPLISTEMWLQLNTFYAKMRNLKRADIRPHLISPLCDTIKQQCQLHVGITAETFYHDEAWNFYCLGQAIERADQTTRLLDVQYHRLLGGRRRADPAEDASQWNALLRAAAGFHAFRRVHPSGMSPMKVVDFFLFDPHFPRSVQACLDAAVNAVVGLRGDYDVPAGKRAERTLTRLRHRLDRKDFRANVERDLHATLDSIQCDLIDTTKALGPLFGETRAS